MRGVQSIDVGCFQINMYYHPGAFATLEQAFDPRANAAYACPGSCSEAARPQRLVGDGDCPVPICTATPSEGEPYRSKVMADWQGGGLRIAPSMQTAMQPLWGTGRAGASDPVVVLISAAALQVRVFRPVSYTPVAFTSTPSATPKIDAQTKWSTARRLPRIITPHG